MTHGTHRTQIPLATCAPALALVLVLAGCAPGPPIAGAPPGATAASPAYVQHLSADQVDAWRGVHYDGLLLDVRSVAEWDDELGHLENAVQVPVEELGSRLTEFERYKGVSVLIYDRDGSRSTRASQMLVTDGFREVSALDGGLKAFRDWQKAR